MTVSYTSHITHAWDHNEWHVHYIIGVYSFTGCITMLVCCLSLQYIILVFIILLAEVAGAILAFVFEAEVCTTNTVLLSKRTALI